MFSIETAYSDIYPQNEQGRGAAITKTTSGDRKIGSLPQSAFEDDVWILDIETVTGKFLFGVQYKKIQN